MTDSELPQHIGFIMDGNRRWARQQGVTTAEGHKRGYQNFRDISELCFDKGMTVATFWAFSTENWRRPKTEIKALMQLLKFALRTELKRLMKRGIRFNALGRISEFPKEIQKEIHHMVEKTKNNTKGILNIGLNYGGREEIVDAVKALIQKGIDASAVTAEMVSQYMYAPELPEPDFIVRTSGEKRSSGFLLWESPYAEWRYSDKLWPDFSEADLDDALEDFKQRKRNFGA